MAHDEMTTGYDAADAPRVPWSDDSEFAGAAPPGDGPPPLDDALAHGTQVAGGRFWVMQTSSGRFYAVICVDSDSLGRMMTAIHLPAPVAAALGGAQLDKAAAQLAVASVAPPHVTTGWRGGYGGGRGYGGGGYRGYGGGGGHYPGAYGHSYGGGGGYPHYGHHEEQQQSYAPPGLPAPPPPQGQPYIAPPPPQGGPYIAPPPPQNTGWMSPFTTGARGGGGGGFRGGFGRGGGGAARFGRFGDRRFHVPGVYGQGSYLELPVGSADDDAEAMAVAEQSPESMEEATGFIARPVAPRSFFSRVVQPRPFASNFTPSFRAPFARPQPFAPRVPFLPPAPPPLAYAPPPAYAEPYPYHHRHHYEEQQQQQQQPDYGYEPQYADQAAPPPPAPVYAAPDAPPPPAPADDPNAPAGAQVDPQDASEITGWFGPNASSTTTGWFGPNNGHTTGWGPRDGHEHERELGYGRERRVDWGGIRAPMADAFAAALGAAQQLASCIASGIDCASAAQIFQQALNAYATPRGFPAVAVDGVLSDATRAAMTALLAQVSQGQTTGFSLGKDSGHDVDHVAGPVVAAVKGVADQAGGALDTAAKSAGIDGTPVHQGAQIVVKAHLGDLDAGKFIRDTVHAARSGVPEAQHAAASLAQGAEFVAHHVDLPRLLADAIPVPPERGIAQHLFGQADPIGRFAESVDRLRRGDFRGLASMAQQDLAEAQGYALVPGVGEGLPTAVAQGEGMLSAGHTLEDAIRGAYDALQIPGAMRPTTDTVLDAVLKLVGSGSVSDSMLVVARDAIPEGFPREVFDSLVHVLARHQPIDHQPVQVAQHYVRAYTRGHHHAVAHGLSRILPAAPAAALQGFQERGRIAGPPLP